MLTLGLIAAIALFALGVYWFWKEPPGGDPEDRSQKSEGRSQEPE
jgi:hypothetical protein